MLGQSGDAARGHAADKLGGFDYRALYAELGTRPPTLVTVVLFGDEGPDGFDALLAAGDGDARRRTWAPETPALSCSTRRGPRAGRRARCSTSGSLLASARGQAERQATGPDDVLVATLPFNDVGGITCTVLHALVAGARVALAAGLCRCGARGRGAAPGDGAGRGADDVRADAGRAGEVRPRPVQRADRSSPAAPTSTRPLARAMAEAFPGAHVENLYGLSETSGACVISAADDDLGTVCETLGTPLSGVEVRVVDPDHRRARCPTGADGELQVRGPVGGRRLLGDAGRDGGGVPRRLAGHRRHGRPAGASGHLVLRGRRKEMFLQGGFNVYPVEVENVLAAHPAVGAGGGHRDPGRRPR